MLRLDGKGDILIMDIRPDTLESRWFRFKGYDRPFSKREHRLLIQRIRYFKHEVKNTLRSEYAEYPNVLSRRYISHSKSVLNVLKSLKKHDYRPYSLTKLSKINDINSIKESKITSIRQCLSQLHSKDVFRDDVFVSTYFGSGLSGNGLSGSVSSLYGFLSDSYLIGNYLTFDVSRFFGLIRGVDYPFSVAESVSYLDSIGFPSEYYSVKRVDGKTSLVFHVPYVVHHAPCWGRKDTLKIGLPLNQSILGFSLDTSFQAFDPLDGRRFLVLDFSFWGGRVKPVSGTHRPSVELSSFEDVVLLLYYLCLGVRGDDLLSAMGLVRKEFSHRERSCTCNRCVKCRARNRKVRQRAINRRKTMWC